MADSAPSFASLCQLTYKDQAVWFLNGFWGDVGNDEARDVWKWVNHFVKLDSEGVEKQGKNGHDLDPFWSAKFLEDMDAAMTQSSRKEALRAIDQDNNGRMSLIEYLTWKFNKSVDDVRNAPQGDNTEAIKRAQQKFDELNAKLLSTQEAKAENERAIAALHQAERDLKAAEEALQAAIAETKKQEEAIEKRRSSLQAVIDSDASSMKKGQASSELAQLNAEDPLPLRRSKITQEAALRKCKKQQKVTADAKVAAEAKAKELAESLVQLENALNEASEELEKIKNRPGGGKGAIWWMQRELFESDAYMPTSKQKFNHRQPFEFNP